MKYECILQVIKTYHTLQGLKTYRVYSISVVAFNENGEGGRSDEITARTLSSRPSDIPQNATLEAASSIVSLYVVFIWKPHCSISPCSAFHH
jgi:hypothetical protein